METYGMAAPINDTAIDCYHQYVAQTGYRCELPEDGDHLKAYSDCPEPAHYNRLHDWYPHRSRNYQDDCAPYRDASYRSSRRDDVNNGRYSSRNGLYYPAELRRGGGDTFNSLPAGLGSYERSMWRRGSRNRWF
ncbi:hypothetical protein AWZ03_007639 [Drosophila navojoa]|uniref:Tes110 n=1 Tax=Drosophila navojoa TaxID=7232 RepID=A0A484BB54_DRONA|nr:uncharacterized protein LOC115562983 isoform X1 [Drosophila navojoa]TDG45919.1 hypothetical protein AWZ03_007639 [Drosophila navojoa]